MAKRKQRIPELWGATEVASYLGVSQPNIHKLDLPESVMTLNRGRLWLASDIRAYKRKRDRDREKQEAERDG